jgi:hypothetical protein
MARQLYGELRNREADGDLVHPDAPGARDAETHVGREHEKCSHRIRVTGADREHGAGESEQAQGELRARTHHRDARLGASLESGEVEARREDALATPEDGHRAGALGRIQRHADLAQHRGGHGVHLAVVERDPRDPVFDPDPGSAFHGASIHLGRLAGNI